MCFCMARVDSYSFPRLQNSCGNLKILMYKNYIVSNSKLLLISIHVNIKFYVLWHKTIKNLIFSIRNKGAN